MKLRTAAACTMSLIYLGFIIATAGAETKDKPAEPELSAQSAVLFCPDNGQVIFGKDENKRMKMASTTKIMTSLLTLEAAEKNDPVIEFKAEMAAEGSSMYLEEGYKLRLSDLAVGMMLASGNDGANAAAFYVAGSQEKFAELMNDRAEIIGMENTSFVTPSGLDDENHYSTAYDMGLLMAEALKNERFAEITSSKQGSITLEYPEGKKLTYSNHNKLLSLYEFCTGGKTGFTKAAGRCLVSSAEKDGVRLVAVTLNAPSDWDDHIALYEYGFSVMTSSEITADELSIAVPAAGTGEKITLAPKESVSYVHRVGEGIFDIEENVRYYVPRFIYMPVLYGEPYGKALIYLGENQVRQVLLYPEGEI